jgi:hypothetical protein
VALRSLKMRVTKVELFECTTQRWRNHLDKKKSGLVLLNY